jgi:hypothetical protein
MLEETGKGKPLKFGQTSKFISMYGVNFEPYREQYQKILPKDLNITKYTMLLKDFFRDPGPQQF